MQTHIRQVERFQYLFAPVGVHVSHYGTNSNNKRRHPQFRTITPSVTGDDVNNSTANTTSNTTTNSTAQTTTVPSATATDSNSNSNNTNTHTVSPTTNRWTKESLSLRHTRNRVMYRSLNVTDIDGILDSLVEFGFETSADIARMQPWQLRVLKKEIPQIDAVYLHAFPMWGKQDYYNDYQNKMFRQFVDFATWLEYNEIHLIMKSFDAQLYGYRCFVCGGAGDICELDQLRWHLWLHHRDDIASQNAMRETKQHWLKRTQNSAFPHNTVIPKLSTDDYAPNVINLVDSDSEDEQPTQNTSSVSRGARKRSKMSPIAAQPSEPTHNPTLMSEAMNSSAAVVGSNHSNAMGFGLNIPDIDESLQFQSHIPFQPRLNPGNSNGSDLDYDADMNMADVAMDLGVDLNDFGMFGRDFASGNNRSVPSSANQVSATSTATTTTNPSVANPSAPAFDPSMPPFESDPFLPQSFYDNSNMDDYDFSRMNGLSPPMSPNAFINHFNNSNGGAPTTTTTTTEFQL